MLAQRRYGLNEQSGFAMKQYVVYYRSWSRKSHSRVELATQKSEAARFVSYNGGQIIGEYTDRETKLRGHRPELAKAVQHALRSAATLVIPNLARLARNVPVTRLLLESQVEFVCLDNEDAIARAFGNTGRAMALAMVLGIANAAAAEPLLARSLAEASVAALPGVRRSARLALGSVTSSAPPGFRIRWHSASIRRMSSMT